jgi:Transposase/Transposase IS116/IS110/IS902 family
LVLAIGIDWAEQFHLVALGRPGQGVIQVLRVEHTPAAVAALWERIATLEADPAEVRVVLETRHGVLVQQLLDAGYTLVPVNPELVARRRGPARKKDDATDARICCLLALDRYADLRPLIPHGPLAAELRAIARDDQRAARDQRRLLNRLRADLLATFPAALQLAADDLAAPTVLKLLERWPTSDLLRRATHDELTGFARSCRHGWPDRFADRVQAAVAADHFIARDYADHFIARDYLVRAKADTIRLAATQLLAIGAQRRVWEPRMAALLGARPTGKSGRRRDERPDNAIPGGTIYLSFPGLGDRLAARVAGEIGDHISHYGSPNALQCDAGTAPVTRRSGKSELVVACRLACNRYLRDAVIRWAFCSLEQSPWARAFYDAQRARGKRHHQALRALANRWLEVLWHCLHNGVRYDEAVHTANRRHALGKAA